MKAHDGKVASVESFKICRIGDLHYAVPVAMVRATLYAHYGVAGDVPFHGERFPVLDPRLLFELAPPPSEHCKAVLLARETPVAALLVDDVQEDDVRIDTRRFQELPWHFGGRERLWFDGVAAVNDQVLIQLHPEGLQVSYRSAVAVDAGPREGGAP